MKFFLLITGLLAAACATEADTLPAILARMDAAAPSFQGASAKIQMTEFNALLSDKTVENGTFQMQKKKGQVRALIAFTGKDDARTLSFFGKTVRIFYPKLGEYQDVDLGNKADLTNQLLLLGFGSSGKDLSAAYTIQSEGDETVGGQTTTKLLLLPKDAQVKEKLAKVEIWIPADAANPVQQQFYEAATGNWRKVTYSDVQLNPTTTGTLELKLPPGAKKQSQ
jgi:outer membrane lipoprotein-sorting protein